MTLPKLSIAAKLYAHLRRYGHNRLGPVGAAIFNARHYAALTDIYESANAGTLNVERVNGLIYAVVMDSRGVYMTPDRGDRKQFIDGIRTFNKQIADVVANWKKSVPADDAELFAQFCQAHCHVHRLPRANWRGSARPMTPAAARVWGVKNRPIRQALNADLDKSHRALRQAGASGAYERDRWQLRSNHDLACPICRAHGAGFAWPCW